MCKKRCLAFLMALLVLLVIPACSTEPTDEENSGNYEVYLDDANVQSGMCLTEEALRWTQDQNTALTQPKEKTKTITVNGTEYTVHYVRSDTDGMGHEYYQYSSEDDRISCKYWANNMNLYMLQLNEQDMSEFADMDQAEYEQWIQNFVSQYYTEDWDHIQPDCTTYIRYTGVNASGARAEKGFVTDFAENENLYIRDFFYCRTIGSLRSADDTSVHFNFRSNNIVAKFNRHNLDPAVLDVDYDKVSAAVNTFVSKYLYPSLHLTSIDLNAGTLTYYGDNLMCRYSVTINYSREGVQEEFTFRMLIDIPDP